MDVLMAQLIGGWLVGRAGRVGQAAAYCLLRVPIEFLANNPALTHAGFDADVIFSVMSGYGFKIFKILHLAYE